MFIDIEKYVGILIDERIGYRVSDEADWLVDRVFDENPDFDIGDDATFTDVVDAVRRADDIASQVLVYLVNDHYEEYQRLIKEALEQ